MLNRVFVYGSLKEGEWNDREIYSKNRISCEKATIVGRIYAVASFPGVKLTGDGVVHGEVHTYPEEKLEKVQRAMDSLEGYVEGRGQNFYDRRVVKATLESGEVVDAWVYEFGRDVYKEIEILSGEWKEGTTPDSVHVRRRSASAE
jgi:gamma-glutamylcyclotransferase (GGCT)/AIG2-like uncharacterized protein YtfP